MEDQRVGKSIIETIPNYQLDSNHDIVYNYIQTNRALEGWGKICSFRFRNMDYGTEKVVIPFAEWLKMVF